MTESFKVAFTAPKRHRFTDLDNFKILRQLLLDSGFLGSNEGVGYDDIKLGESYEGFGVAGNLFWFDDTIGCGQRVEDQLNTVVERYSKRFPILKFRYVRVGDDLRVAETLKNGDILTSATSNV